LIGQEYRKEIEHIHIEGQKDQGKKIVGGPEMAQLPMAITYRGAGI
jgi:hypothetical protein